MGGEQPGEVEVRWNGLAGDRRYALLLEGDVTRFPWFTSRLHPALLRWSARVLPGEAAQSDPVEVTSAAGERLSADDRAIADRLGSESGRQLQLLHLGRGCFDAAPVSLISSASVEAVCRAAGVEPDARRFRPNLVVELPTGEPFEEERWVGRELQVGAEARFRVDRRNERCAVTMLDPDDTTQTVDVLRWLASERQACLGLYLTPTRTGRIRPADPVRLLDPGE